MLFDSVVWWPSAEGLMGLMGMIDVIGPGGVGVHGCNDGPSTRAGSIEEGDSGDAIASFVVRGESVRLNSLKIEPQFDIQHWGSKPEPPKIPSS